MILMMKRTRLTRGQKHKNLPTRLYLALTGKLPSGLRSMKSGKKLKLEASRKTPMKEQYIDFAYSRPPKQYRKEAVSKVIEEIKRVSPHAKITLLPLPEKLVWFQDIRVSNISAGDALELEGSLGAIGVIQKI